MSKLTAFFVKKLDNFPADWLINMSCTDVACNFAVSDTNVVTRSLLDSSRTNMFVEANEFNYVKNQRIKDLTHEASERVIFEGTTTFFHMLYATGRIPFTPEINCSMYFAHAVTQAGSPENPKGEIMFDEKLIVFENMIDELKLKLVNLMNTYPTIEHCNMIDNCNTIEECIVKYSEECIVN